MTQQTANSPAATLGRPSLRQPSMFAIGWHCATWGGLAIIGHSLVNLDRASLAAMGAPLAMIVLLVVLSELRPIVMSRLVGNPVSFSAAFVFATMYMWGLGPAAVMFAGSVAASELIRHKALWKLAFNVGQYALSLTAAWLVVLLSGHDPSPSNPLTGLSGSDAWWIIGSWFAYHLVNLALVALLAGDEELTWWDSFSEEFWFYTFSALSVLALSPMVVLMCTANPGSWALLPLLLLPLLAVQKTAEMSRAKEHQALHDPLTGLPNRVLLGTRIEGMLAQARRTGTTVVVTFLDVDRFKLVNDSLGHFVGDEMLVQLAERLRGATLPSETLARFGGDEFVVVSRCEPAQAEEPANRVARCLAAPFPLAGQPYQATASIGVAVAGPRSDAQTLLRDADSAMYRAKGAGRGRVALFDLDMHRLAAHQLETEAGLRAAIAADDLRVHYQPIIDLRSGGTIAVEALVRWEHPQRGLIGPGQFIPLAEETGLIGPVGMYVLRSALGQLGAWRQQFPAAQELGLSVNLSARQLDDLELPAMVAAEIALANFPASALSLEITESSVMDQSGPWRDCLEQLRRLGVALAIDDFGTGYATYSYLSDLPVSTLKIDRSFVGGIADPDGVHQPEIVRAMVSMAESLNLSVVAEGVETEDQLVILRRLGAHMAQGYLWSAPLPADRFEVWLEAQQCGVPPGR